MSTRIGQAVRAKSVRNRDWNTPMSEKTFLSSERWSCVRSPGSM